MIYKPSYLYCFQLIDKIKSMRMVLFLLPLAIPSSFFAQNINHPPINNSGFEQNVLASAGSVDQTSEIQLEWNLGESFTGNISGALAWYTIGFHQPTIQVRRNQSELVLSELGVKVFPNPFSDEINIKLTAPAPGSIKLKITDLIGRSVLERTMDEGSSDLTIFCADFPAGSYFLRMWDSNESLLHSAVIIKSM